MIDHATVEKIFDVANIVDVVQDFVSLKKRGVNYIGLCPFHNEKTPSFTVSPSKGIFKCFGCGKGGNAVTFIMEQEHLSYYEALLFLAKKYHIEVVEKELTAEEIQQKTEAESLLVLNSFAQKYFSDTLINHKEGKAIGMAYFKERGFREDIIDRFKLGYSLEQRDAFTQNAIKNGFKKDYLVKSGLTIQGENHSFDRFSGRVMFPIFGLSGKIIGFGGRTLKKDKQTAKYVNSPESEIYHKSKVLYGLYQARQAIVQHNKCYLVEGYADVISMHQVGIENTIASSGTSLTVDQIRLMKRFTPNVTILYDGDAAGIKASIRGIDMVLEEGLNVKVLLLPDGEDPDSFAQKHGASEFEQYIAQNESDFISFKIKLLLEDTQGDPIKKAGLIAEVVRSIAIIPDIITRSVYVRECAANLDVGEQVIYAEIAKIRRTKAEQKYGWQKTESGKKSQEPASSSSIVISDPSEIIEKDIIRLLLNYGNNILFVLKDEEGNAQQISVASYIIHELTADELELQNPVFKQIYEEIQQALTQNTPIDNKYFVHHPDKEIAQLAADLLSNSYHLSKMWKVDILFDDTLKKWVLDTIMSFKNQKILTVLRQTQNQLIRAQEEKDLEEIEELQDKYMVLNDCKKRLSKERVILY
ncbi:MAG: DNA primase [Bacteroidota bacterium]|nr:DNA primase [Bacteroidota bacterium]